MKVQIPPLDNNGFAYVSWAGLLFVGFLICFSREETWYFLVTKWLYSGDHKCTLPTYNLGFSVFNILCLDLR